MRLDQTVVGLRTMLIAKGQVLDGRSAWFDHFGQPMLITLQP
jgi:hypothetical protein